MSFRKKIHLVSLILGLLVLPIMVNYESFYFAMFQCYCLGGMTQVLLEDK